MTDTVLFSFAEDETLGASLCNLTGAEHGAWEHHRFPDGESLVRLDTDVSGKHVMILCSLLEPDRKILPLLFLADTARELGAKRVGLVSPYLAYMRQDIRFHDGEAITSRIFAALLSRHVDWLVTVDPHLHRYHSLDEIYTIPSLVVPAAPTVAEWIRKHIGNPLLVGPDEESEQWVGEVAAKAEAPFIVLRKTRHGDRDVSVSAPDADAYRDRVPVLVDDIISSARTMATTTRQLLAQGFRPPVCIGVHGIFGEDGFGTLKAAGVERILTCNTLPHETNAIVLDAPLAEAIKHIIAGYGTAA